MNQTKQSDGRVYTNWLSGGEHNKQIRVKKGIKTNKEYRDFLMKNADSIIANNQRLACSQASNVPYFRSGNDKSNAKNAVGDAGSDLKNLYFSRNAINKRYDTPVLGQEALLQYSNPN